MKPVFQQHTCLTEGDIRGYLEDRLSAEDRHRVENHMLDCPLCAEAMEGWELMAAAEQKEAAPAKVRKFQWRSFAVAAALLALVAAVVWVFSVSENSGRLYAEYFDHYESDVTLSLRGADGQNIQASDLETGLEAYEQGDYAQAASRLEAFLTETPDHLIARFYLGMALMEESRWQEAEVQLQKVRAAGGSYQEEASWYLALNYIKNKRPDDAAALLKSLTQKGGGRYYEEANKLLSKL